jgi:hypothetical protein
MDELRSLGESASLWGWLSVALLIALGVADLIAFILETRAHGWSRAAKVELVGLVFLIGLGLVDWKARAVEEKRAQVLERAALDRDIEPNARSKAIEKLRARPATIVMRCLGSSAREVADYCDAIEGMFRESGWNVQRGNTGVFADSGPQVSGVKLSWIEGDRPSAVDVAKEALDVIDARPSVEPGPSGAGREGTAFVLVAQKPGLSKK